MTTSNKKITDEGIEKVRQWHGLMSSTGRLHLSLYYKNLSDDELLEAMGEAVDAGARSMLEKGYIPHDAALMTSRDIAREFGSSRQYWEKLLREGKIPFHQTSAGRVTVDLWVTGYLKNRREVDDYVRWQKAAVKRALESNRRSGTINCPRCEEPRLDFSKNHHEINGVCRARCAFGFTTAIESK